MRGTARANFFGACVRCGTGRAGEKAENERLLLVDTWFPVFTVVRLGAARLVVVRPADRLPGESVLLVSMSLSQPGSGARTCTSFSGRIPRARKYNIYAVQPKKKIVIVREKKMNSGELNSMRIHVY